MAEPTTPLLATGGLTLFGIVTGLHPMLLVAGFVGCWWYNSYLPEISLGQRIATGIVAAMVAAWTTPPIVIFLTGLPWWPPAVPSLIAGFPCALAFGFMTHRVIGPTLLRAAQKKAEELV